MNEDLIIYLGLLVSISIGIFLNILINTIGLIVAYKINKKYKNNLFEMIKGVNNYMKQIIVFSIVILIISLILALLSIKIYILMMILLGIISMITSATYVYGIFIDKNQNSNK